MAADYQNTYGWCRKLKPILIADIPESDDTTCPRLALDKLEKIITYWGISDYPVFVLSIAGVQNSGKTFFLRLLNTYLFYYNQLGTDCYWDEVLDLPIEKLDIPQGTQLPANGLWVWDQPFFVNDVAILLVDCQGYRRSKTDKYLQENAIIYLSLHLSSAQIINLNRLAQPSDFERLALCSEYRRDHFQEKLKFKSLLFLVRNWEEDQIYGERPRVFDTMLGASRSASITKCMLDVKTSFRYITTYVHPYPGSCVSGTAKEQIKLEDVNDEFLCASKRLFNRLVLQLPKSRDHLMTGKHLIAHFKTVAQAVVDSDTGRLSLRSLADTREEILVKAAFNAAFKYYDHEMSKVFRVAYDTEEDLDQHLREILKDSVIRFERDDTITKYKNSPIYRKYKEDLKNKEENLEEKKIFILHAQQLIKEVESSLLSITEQIERIPKTVMNLSDHKSLVLRLRRNLSVNSHRRKEIQEVEERVKRQQTELLNSYRMVSESRVSGFLQMEEEDEQKIKETEQLTKLRQELASLAMERKNIEEAEANIRKKIEQYNSSLDESSA